MLMLEIYLLGLFSVMVTDVSTTFELDPALEPPSPFTVCAPVHDTIDVELPFEALSPLSSASRDFWCDIEDDLVDPVFYQGACDDIEQLLTGMADADERFRSRRQLESSEPRRVLRPATHAVTKKAAEKAPKPAPETTSAGKKRKRPGSPAGPVPPQRRSKRLATSARTSTSAASTSVTAPAASTSVVASTSSAAAVGKTPAGSAGAITTAAPTQENDSDDDSDHQQRAPRIRRPRRVVIIWKPRNPRTRILTSDELELLWYFGTTRKQIGNAATPDYVVALLSISSYEEQKRVNSWFKNHRFEIVCPDDANMTGGYMKYKFNARAGRSLRALTPNIDCFPRTYCMGCKAPVSRNDMHRWCRDCSAENGDLQCPLNGVCRVCLSMNWLDLKTRYKRLCETLMNHAAGVTTSRHVLLLDVACQYDANCRVVDEFKRSENRTLAHIPPGVVRPAVSLEILRPPPDDEIPLPRINQGAAPANVDPFTKHKPGSRQYRRDNARYHADRAMLATLPAPNAPGRRLTLFEVERLHKKYRHRTGIDTRATEAEKDLVRPSDDVSFCRRAHDKPALKRRDDPHRDDWQQKFTSSAPTKTVKVSFTPEHEQFQLGDAPMTSCVPVDGHRLQMYDQKTDGDVTRQQEVYIKNSWKRMCSEAVPGGPPDPPALWWCSVTGRYIERGPNWRRPFEPPLPTEDEYINMPDYGELPPLYLTEPWASIRPVTSATSTPSVAPVVATPPLVTVVSRPTSQTITSATVSVIKRAPATATETTTATVVSVLSPTGSTGAIVAQSTSAAAPLTATTSAALPVSSTGAITTASGNATVTVSACQPTASAGAIIAAPLNAVVTASDFQPTGSAGVIIEDVNAVTASSPLSMAMIPIMSAAATSHSISQGPVIEIASDVDDEHLGGADIDDAGSISGNLPAASLIAPSDTVTVDISGDAEEDPNWISAAGDAVTVTQPNLEGDAQPAPSAIMDDVAAAGLNVVVTSPLSDANAAVGTATTQSTALKTIGDAYAAPSTQDSSSSAEQGPRTMKKLANLAARVILLENQRLVAMAEGSGSLHVTPVLTSDDSGSGTRRIQSPTVADDSQRVVTDALALLDLSEGTATQPIYIDTAPSTAAASVYGAHDDVVTAGSALDVDTVSFEPTEDTAADTDATIDEARAAAAVAAVTDAADVIAEARAAAAAATTAAVTDAADTQDDVIVVAEALDPAPVEVEPEAHLVQQIIESGGAGNAEAPAQTCSSTAEPVLAAAESALEHSDASMREMVRVSAPTGSAGALPSAVSTAADTETTHSEDSAAQQRAVSAPPTAAATVDAGGVPQLRDDGSVTSSWADYRTVSGSVRSWMSVSSYHTAMTDSVRWLRALDLQYRYQEDRLVLSPLLQALDLAVLRKRSRRHVLPLSYAAKALLAKREHLPYPPRATLVAQWLAAIPMVERHTDE